MVYVVETSQLWTLLAKICRANQLKEEKQKSIFDLRTDEASESQYFQVQKFINTQLVTLILCYTLYSGMATSGNNRTCYR